MPRQPGAYAGAEAQARLRREVEDTIVRMVGAIGGDLVGMSTALEAIAAREAGLEVLGISLVTNLAAGINDAPLNHEEVLEAGRSAASRMGGLLAAITPRLI